MSSGKEYRLAIKIAGEIEKSFENSVKLTKRQLRQIAREAQMANLTFSERLGKELKDCSPLFDRLDKAAGVAFKTVLTGAAAASAAVGSIAYASIKVGSEFESAFAGVRKTVDATEEEFGALEDRIRGMSLKMPSSAAELSAIAESAGQLGIAKENIGDFTETMAQMSVATDMTSEDAASQFAQFANIVQMGQDKFDELGSTVVALGNNTATTESKIMEMAMRLAGAGAQINLTEDQIMAMSASLSSVGIEAEAGGSAFSKLMVAMQLAVETGNKSLGKYAKVAGMTTEEFKKAFQENATDAILAFTGGLNDVERNGMSAIAVLDDMEIREVRLRDALLRAAGANDVFQRTMTIANRAWHENTALSNEAAQRYMTFESQLDITGNNMADIGISAYQSMRTPLTEGLYAVNNELIAGIRESVIESGFIDNLAESMEKKIPTLVREAKQLGKATKEFSEPFLEVGGWLADNPGLLVGTITGVGTALAAHKTASAIAAIGPALAALASNPVGLAIAGLGAVTGAVIGITTAVKKNAAEMKKVSLDEHFGDISLSLAELDKTAEGIIASDNLGKIRESVAAFEELDGIQDRIDDAVETMNKTEWKLSIGLELSESEMEDYRSSVAAYVEQTQKYVTDQQYAATLAVGVLTEGDLESQNIVDQMNAFYADKRGELSALGEDLNNAITEAFLDGLLEPEESINISKIQESIAEAQRALADANYEAELQSLTAKYGVGELDAESFQNLQAELAEKTAEASRAYEDAYKSAVATQNMMMKEGDITEDEYKANIDSITTGYREQVGELQMRANTFQTDTIMKQYEDELSTAIPQLQEKVDGLMKEVLSEEYTWQWQENALGMAAMIDQELANVGGMNKADRAGIDALLEQMAPSAEQTEQLITEYREAGKQIPQAWMDGMNEYYTLKVLSGDQESLWNYMGDLVGNDAEYAAFIEKMEADGVRVPETLARAIDKNKNTVDDAIDGLWGHTDQTLRARFEKDFTVDANVRFHTDIMYPTYKSIGATAADKKATVGGMVTDGHAKGGIFTEPHVAWFAEAGPEAAIPLDGSQNAINLWRETGNILGVESMESPRVGLSALAYEINNEAPVSAGAQISFQPEMNFYGDSPNRKDVEDAFDSAFDKFSAMMQQWIHEQGRTSFGFGR